MDYTNKYFSILGDSISTLEGYSEPKGAEFYELSYKLASGVFTLLDTWWGQVIDRLGGKLLRNNSISGSTVCWHPSYEIPSYGCSDERTSSLGKEGLNPDVIMVFLGVNDWGAGLPIRSHNTLQAETENPADFLSAYQKMLQKLKRNYPNAEIWCLTLPVSRCAEKGIEEFPYYYGGRHIAEYCEAIQEAAQEYGCRVIDLYAKKEPHDTIDGFHPNANGMMVLAEGVLTNLNM